MDLNSSKPIGNQTNEQKSSTKFESFHEVLQRSLKDQAGSRPPKVEVTGILTPKGRSIQIWVGTRAYFLEMNRKHEELARKFLWEEATVRGYLDLGQNVLEVEKLILVNEVDPSRSGVASEDNWFEHDFFKRTIQKRGMLEPSIDYLAS